MRVIVKLHVRHIGDSFKVEMLLLLDVGLEFLFNEVNHEFLEKKALPSSSCLLTWTGIYKVIPNFISNRDLDRIVVYGDGTHVPHLVVHFVHE